MGRLSSSRIARGVRPAAAAILLVGLALACASCVSAQSLTALSTNIASAPFAPAFDANAADRFYTITVPSSTQSIQFDAATTAGSTLTATWNGSPVSVNGGETPALRIDSSKQYSELILTLKTTNKADVVYTINVLLSQVVSKNANLISFSVVPADAVIAMNPATYSSQVFSYAITLRSTTETFQISPTFDATATVVVLSREMQASDPAQPSAPVSGASTPISVSSGVFSQPLAIAAGQRFQLEVDVTAEDKSTKKQYLFVVSRSSSTATDQSAAGSASSSGGGDSTVLRSAASGIGATVWPLLLASALWLARTLAN